MKIEIPSEAIDQIILEEMQDIIKWAEYDKERKAALRIALYYTVSGSSEQRELKRLYKEWKYNG